MTKLEQVARAIALSNGVNPDSLHPNKLGDEIKSGWEWHLPQARAAVETLREPDGPMLNAMWNADGDYSRFRDTWKAMVDEILKERPE